MAPMSPSEKENFVFFWRQRTNTKKKIILFLLTAFLPAQGHGRSMIFFEGGPYRRAGQYYIAIHYYFA